MLAQLPSPHRCAIQLLTGPGAGPPHSAQARVANARAALSRLAARAEEGRSL